MQTTNIMINASSQFILLTIMPNDYHNQQYEN